MKKKVLLAIAALVAIGISACSPSTSSSAGPSSSEPTPSSSSEISSEHSSSSEQSSSEHEHVYGAWHYDEEKHWKECEECQEKAYVGAHEDNEKIIQEAKCEEEGRKEIVCQICERRYETTIEALEHDFTNQLSIVAPTHELEGSVTYGCKNGCGETQTFKILRIPTLELVGSSFVWSEVENATGYKFFKDEQEIDVGGLTSYELSQADLNVETFGVRAYTTDSNYVEYDDVKAEVRLYKQSNNIQALYNCDFESGSGIKLSRTASWNVYPYGNWSDLDNSGVGGWYYIETQEDGNTCLKVPAVVWYPGNTTIKKDLSRETAQPGTYEISFDIKASHEAMTNNVNGKYGALAMYMWNDCENRVGVTDVHATSSWVVKDIANEDTWSNVRVRYTINTLGTYNQFNLIYWPESSVSEANCIYLDNIEVYKVVGGEVVEENIDTLEGGDLEKWSTNPMTQNMWYAGDTVLIEPSAIGSSFIEEENNHALKIQSASKEAAFNLKGNISELRKGGLFEMNFKLKKGSDLSDPAFGFTMWSFKNGTSFQLVDVTPISISDANANEYTQYSVRFFSKGHEGADSLNIYYWIELDNANNDSENKYIIIDDVAIYKLDTNYEQPINLLYIGNSHGDDTIEHVYRILDNINYEQSINIYSLFIGGSSIENHYTNFSKNLSAYEMRYWNYETKVWNTKTCVSIQTALGLCSYWDYVVFQESARYCLFADNFDHFDELTAGVREIVGAETKFYVNATFSYTQNEINSNAQLNELVTNPLDMWEKAYAKWETVVADGNEYGVVGLIPVGTAIQNMRTKYSDSVLFRDYIHLSFGFGRFVAGLTFVQYIFGDITNCSFRPSDTNETQALDAITCALSAIESPYEITSL